MNKRHYIAILLTLAVCFGALLLFYRIEKSSINNKEQEPPLYRIQVILKAKANPPDFWRIVEQGVMVAAQEYGAVCEVTGPTSEDDIDRQIEQMKEAIAKQPDAIVLAATDYERLVPICERAVKEGILLVTVDSDVNYTGRKCFVGTDNYQLGKSLAEQVDLLTEKKGKVGVVGHVATVTTAIDRERGLTENLTDADSRITDVVYCNGLVETARKQAISMLQNNPDIVCMVGLNETSAMGIAYALEQLKLEKDVKLVACDCSEKQIQMMERGTIQAFVIQNPFNMGYVSIKSTIELLQGKNVPANYNTQSVVVTKDTLYKNENQKLLFPFVDDQ